MSEKDTTPESRREPISDAPADAIVPQTKTPPEVPSPTKSEPLEFLDIQAIALTGYGHLPHAAYLFLRFPRTATFGVNTAEILTPAARAALAQTAQEVMPMRHEKDRAKRPKTSMNLAFTYAGLTALGLSQETLQTFPPEFRGGMTEDFRARALGDVGGNDPKYWEWGGTKEGIQTAPETKGISDKKIPIPDTDKEPDLVLLCFASSANRLDDLTTLLKKRWVDDAGAVLIADERSTPNMPDSKEHFGFRDNITSVKVEGAFGVKDPGQSVVRAGEFLLDYPNEYGQRTTRPRLNPSKNIDGKDIGRNGTYLAFRKLEQDVASFWKYCREQAGIINGNREASPSGGDTIPFPPPLALPATPEFVGAKMMGRWPSGAPLALCPFADNKPLGADPQKRNDFGYADHDLHGFACPLGSHIRRANPRDQLSTLNAAGSHTVVNRHRILRRGRPYGPPLENAAQNDGQKRGLLFFCVNASLARQFEFVQQTWITDPKFARLWNEPDPITGSSDNIDKDAPNAAEFTIPQATLRIRLKAVPRFVTVKAGVYMFLPGITGLRYLINDNGAA